MNIENLIAQLNAIYTDPVQTRASSLKTLAEIHSLLLNTVYELDHRCNMVEMYLINCIYREEDKAKKNIFKLSLKIVLLNRGYFTDAAGTLEKALLQLRNESTLKGTWNTLLDYNFINRLSCKFSNCFQTPKTNTEKIQDIINIIRKLRKKHTGIELTYLNRCLAKAREFKLNSSVIEHSIWASAALESLRYLEVLTAKNARYNFAGTEQMKTKELADQIKTHIIRAQYFIARSKELFEPIGHYVETKIDSIVILENECASPRPIAKSNISVPLAELKLQYATNHQAKIHSDIMLFAEAHDGILKRNLGVAFDCAHTLKKNNNAFGTFIKIIANMLSAPISEERWKYCLERLQDTVIPNNKRQQIAELWLCLSNHFHENSGDKNPHYKACAIICAKKITQKYGNKAFLMAKLQLAKIDANKELFQSISEDLLKLDNLSVLQENENDFDYPLQLQYVYVNYLLQPDANVEKMKYLMTENYPFGIEIILQCLLNKSSVEYPSAKEAAEQYGPSYDNPIKLCAILRKQTFNNYIIIWTRIYCDTIANGFLQEQIMEWRRLNLNDNDINYKLYSYARSLLYSAIHDPNQIVPGGTTYLNEIDLKLYAIVIQMMEEIQENTQSTLFAFTRNHLGLLEACFAELAFYENNIPLVERLATLSINANESRIISPRRSLPNAKSPPLTRMETGLSDMEISAGSRPRSLALALNNSGSIEPALVPRVSSNEVEAVMQSPRKLTGLSLGIKKFSHVKSLSKKTGEQLNSSPPSTSPRSLDTSQARFGLIADDQTNDFISSHLGYFYYAQAIYSTHLNNNRNPQSTHLVQFRKNLDKARNAPNKQELAYINARIWLNYLNNERDSRWITDAELKTLEGEIERYNPDLAEVKILEVKKVPDFFINSKIKTQLEDALNPINGFSQTKRKMFPPAANMYAKELCYAYDSLPIASLIDYLDEAIGTHGFLPALYEYALLVNRNLEKYRHEGNLRQLLEKIKQYLDCSERYVYLEPGQKREIVENIAALTHVEQRIEQFGTYLNGNEKKNSELLHKILNFITSEADIARTCQVSKSFNYTAISILSDRKRLRGYPKEKVIALRETLFSQKPCVLQGQSASFTMQYLIAINSDDCGFQFVCSNETLFNKLSPYFRFAENFYTYTKKVTLAENIIQLIPKTNTIFVLHHDIAIIAMLKLSDNCMKKSDKFFNKMAISPLLELLKEEHTKKTVKWQWGRTPNRIESTIENYNVTLVKIAAKNIPSLMRQASSQPGPRTETRKKAADSVHSPLPLLDPLTIANQRSPRSDSADSTPNLESPQSLRLPHRKGGSSTSRTPRPASMLSRSRTNSLTALSPQMHNKNSTDSSPSEPSPRLDKK